jgi:hypothetical protein
MGICQSSCVFSLSRTGSKSFSTSSPWRFGGLWEAEKPGLGWGKGKKTGGSQYTVLQASPEVGTVEGLASRLVDILAETTWADRVHILHALLRLVPDVSRELRSRLQGSILHLLNLEQPPTFQVSPWIPLASPSTSHTNHCLPTCAQDEIQKQFVILALQLLLACFLESRDVVLELMSYFLYSPDTYR